MMQDFGKEAAMAQETYEAKLGKEMLERVGKNPKGKGVVHEMMYRDKLNSDPRAILKGEHTELTKSTTAVRDDLVTMKDGKVVKRYQLKDTPASSAHTVKQGTSKKYAGTNFMGTEETVDGYNRVAGKSKKPTQKMTSTGISSKDTERVANKALGKQVSGTCILSGAKTAAKGGAAVSAAVNLVQMALDDESHTAGEVVEETTKSAATGAATGAGSFAGAEVGTAIAAAIGLHGLGALVAPIAGAVAVGDVVSTVAKPTVEGLVDAVKYGSPTLLRCGIEEGLGDLQDKVEEKTDAVRDALCDAVEGAGEFFSDLWDSICFGGWMF